MNLLIEDLEAAWNREKMIMLQSATKIQSFNGYKNVFHMWVKRANVASCRVDGIKNKRNEVIWHESQMKEFQKQYFRHGYGNYNDMLKSKIEPNTIA